MSAPAGGRADAGSSAHRYECHIRFSDVDVYGHVNNVKYFEYFQEARIAFLRQRVALLDPSSTERQVVARIDVDYKRPMLFRAQPYEVLTWVTAIGTSSYRVAARIVDEQDTVYSTADVRLVAFDSATQRSRPLADHERTFLQAALVE
jgi:acyl-CoA thioester hydrolase